jgi:hypothetical protein
VSSGLLEIGQVEGDQRDGAGRPGAQQEAAGQAGDDLWVPQDPARADLRQLELSLG